MSLILFILISAGITLIVTKSYLFKPMRRYLKRKSTFLCILFSCPACFGFHSGWFVALFINPLTNDMNQVASIISCGFISSCTSLVIGLVIEYTKLRIKHLKNALK